MKAIRTKNKRRGRVRQFLHAEVDHERNELVIRYKDWPLLGAWLAARKEKAAKALK